jgi:pimeloyl-ACP methyl ester carboxylesterase
VDSHRLRVFYTSHSLVAILPKPLPLLVFIHGLGAQINQFEPLLGHFGQVADVLAIDLPGCGQSPYTDRRWDSYTTEALAELVNQVIEKMSGDRKVVFIGHSLGCLITGRLALKLGDKCLAAVLLCPKAEISEQEKQGIRLITRLPEFLFNILRRRDRAYLSTPWEI